MLLLLGLNATHSYFACVWCKVHKKTGKDKLRTCIVIHDHGYTLIQVGFIFEVSNLQNFVCLQILIVCKLMPCV